MGRASTRVAVMALMFLLPAVPASAAKLSNLKLPSEIRGTIGGFTVGDAYDVFADRHWSGPIVLKRVTRYSSTYKVAAGTAIAWNATLAAPCSGTGHGTLGPNQLTGELLIQGPNREAGGYVWTVIIAPYQKSQADAPPMQVSGTCPAADGSSVPFTDDAVTNLVINNLDKSS